MYRALLIDDEWLTMVSAQGSLNLPEHGFHDVVTCTNPFEALHLLRSQRFDAAFVDIRMPELSGLELIERASGLDTAFVILTGYADFSLAQQAIRLSAFDYCLKPLQSEDAAVLMQKLLPHLRARRQESDPALYRRLCQSQNPEQELSYLGLPPAPRLAVACVAGAGQSIFERDLPGGAGQAALRVHEGLYAKLMAVPGELPDLAAHFAALPQPAGAAFCELDIREAGLLKSLLPHAATLAEHLSAQAVREGGRQVQRFFPRQIQDWGPDFVNLFEEASQRFLEDLSLRELAERHHVNYSYASTLFRQRTGLSFRKYINQLRLERARELMRTTGLTIGQISENVGYNNYNHFVATFKKVYHMTPTDYLRTVKGGDAP